MESTEKPMVVPLVILVNEKMSERNRKRVNGVIACVEEISTEIPVSIMYLRAVFEGGVVGIVVSMFGGEMEAYEAFALLNLLNDNKLAAVSCMGPNTDGVDLWQSDGHARKVAEHFVSNYQKRQLPKQVQVIGLQS